MTIPQTPRHDFLHELHKLLRPATYLEIGVQTGRSMEQALAGRPDVCAIGVDPRPVPHRPMPPGTMIYASTSDEYFGGYGVTGLPGPIDLAFIDGMHLVENCLRDFMNVERHARPDGRTVAVFDDVLPYSHTIATREPLPGDWTGDCWKINTILHVHRPDLLQILVDVDPTGALVVLGLDPTNAALPLLYPTIMATYGNDIVPPDRYVDRSTAVRPDVALNLIRSHLEALA